MNRGAYTAFIVLLALLGISCDSRSAIATGVGGAGQGRMTLDTYFGIRSAVSLEMSPDGQRFAVLVESMDPGRNRYLTSWEVGSISGGPLLDVGSGGAPGLAKNRLGFEGGDLEVPVAKWSPDGRWIAYIEKSDGTTTLWRSSTASGTRFRVTAGNVQSFNWTGSQRIVVGMGASPQEQARLAQERDRAGYAYNSELWSFLDFMKPEMPIASVQPIVRIREVDIKTGKVRDANAVDAQWLRDIDHPIAKTNRVNGSLLHIAGQSDGMTRLTVSPKRGGTITCRFSACSEALHDAWWSEDGATVLFWVGEGLNSRENEFYSWRPESNVLTRLAVVAPDDDLQQCDLGTADTLVCIRETNSSPSHVVTYDTRSGKRNVVAAFNPELNSVRLGRVEKIVWKTPRLGWNEPGGAHPGLYPGRAYGFIYYPPDFDPHKKYPLFVDPYSPHGFGRSVGAEHPLIVYAANGIVVLSAAFPWPTDPKVSMSELYSERLGFPHLTMLAESTLAGIDSVVARGFIDSSRIGIGGVSHGTFVPLFIMQHWNRFAAASISAVGFGPEQYYWPTLLGREAIGSALGAFPPNPGGAGEAYYYKIDIAEHVAQISAPILMHHAAYEAYTAVRFMRNLDDARKPYDAYIFPNETHEKWQPSHIRTVQARNLDWFRFWLQDIEDPDPAKRNQYARWRQLRALQCKEPRSLRDYCRAKSIMLQPTQ